MSRLLCLVALLPLAACFAQDKAEKGALTNDNLKPTLADMGLKPKELSKGLCEVEITRDDYRATVRVTAGSDGRLLYLIVRGSVVNRPAEMPAKFWKLLLVANDTNSTSHTLWSYNKDLRVLELTRYVSNRGLTPAALREINSFHALVKKNNDVWKTKEPAFVPIKDSAADTKERARLKGTWRASEVVLAGEKLTEEQLKAQTKEKPIEIVFDDKGGSLQIGGKEKFVSRLGPGVMALYVGEPRRLSQARYKLDKDTLTVCLDSTGMGFPPTLESTATNRYVAFTMKRAKE